MSQQNYFHMIVSAIHEGRKEEKLKSRRQLEQGLEVTKGPKGAFVFHKKQ
jgi:hypothetical protein